MVTVTELNRAPNITVNAIDANTVDASDVITAPKYPTRADVPDKEGIYRVADVDGEGNFGIIAREI